MIPEALERILRSFPAVAVALSGGVDSGVLAAAAVRILGPERVRTLTAVGPIFPSGEGQWARRTADLLGTDHREIFFDPLGLPAFLQNPPDRCYYCKRELLVRFREEAGGWVLCDGTQADDLRTDRPGLRALRELGVRSPLAEAGLSKEEVRALARNLGLPQARKPPSPCLATRFPPGEPVRREALERVARAEEILRKMLGLEVLRVRFVRGEARLEVPPSAMEAVFARRGEISRSLLDLGFKRVSLDLIGYF